MSDFNLTVPAVTLHESDLPVYAALMGKVNSAPIAIGEGTYEAKTVKFVTFAGAALKNDHDTYVGELRYLSGDYSAATADQCADLNIKATPAAVKPTPSLDKPADAAGDK